ncbi:2'-5' RNA ligase family protein [Streptomyces hebeiensis]
MINHWDRPGWSAATRRYYWMITFPGEDPLIEHARGCQRAIEPLGFDPIPGSGLHMTLLRIGDTSHVPPATIDQLAATAHREVPRAFTIHAIPLTASRGAIRYSVAPWTPILALHAALSRAGECHDIPTARSTHLLRPHIGIAYCNRPMPTASVRDAVAPLRALTSIPLKVSHVRLVELRRDSRRYQWTIHHEVSLASSDT